MNDLLLEDIAFVLNASKRRSYRAEVLQVAEALVRFLQENGLTTKTIVAPSEPIPHDLKIWRSDLTDEGYEFYKGPVQRWYHAQDRGVEPTDTRILEQGLVTLRKS